MYELKYSWKSRNETEYKDSLYLLQYVKLKQNQLEKQRSTLVELGRGKCQVLASTADSLEGPKISTENISNVCANLEETHNEGEIKHYTWGVTVTEESCDAKGKAKHGEEELLERRTFEEARAEKQCIGGESITGESCEQGVKLNMGKSILIEWRTSEVGDAGEDEEAETT